MEPGPEISTFLYSTIFNVSISIRRQLSLSTYRNQCSSYIYFAPGPISREEKLHLDPHSLIALSRVLSLSLGNKAAVLTESSNTFPFEVPSISFTFQRTSGFPTTHPLLYFWKVNFPLQYAFQFDFPSKHCHLGLIEFQSVYPPHPALILDTSIFT